MDIIKKAGNYLTYLEREKSRAEAHITEINNLLPTLRSLAGQAKTEPVKATEAKTTKSVTKKVKGFVLTANHAKRVPLMGALRQHILSLDPSRTYTAGDVNAAVEASGIKFTKDQVHSALYHLRKDGFLHATGTAPYSYMIGRMP